jgi:hypothetical protein
MKRAIRWMLACAILLAPSVLAGAEPAAPFLGARNEPPAGRVIHGWGEFSQAWNLGGTAGKGEEANLKDYIKSVAPNEPAMFSFFVAPQFKSLPAFLNRYREFARGRGFFVALVGFNFRGMEHDVSIGMKDPELWGLADGLKEVGRPSLIRVGYEFNNPRALYEPSGYIGGFRHLAEIARKDDANIATVWDASAAGLASGDYMKWYPGDDVVDWWGIDLFDPSDFTNPATAAFVDAAARHHKPVLIGAASPVFQAGHGDVRGPRSDSEAMKWYASLFDFIRAHPQVQALSLVAIDWRRLHDLSGKGSPDARLARWPGVAAVVKKQLSDPRFINAQDASRLLQRSADESR